MVTWNRTTWGGDIEGSGLLYKEGHCLSTDEKPTGGDLYNGSKLIEMDTGKVCYYDADGETWIEFGGTSEEV